MPRTGPMTRSASAPRWRRRQPRPAFGTISDGIQAKPRTRRCGDRRGRDGDQPKPRGDRRAQRAHPRHPRPVGRSVITPRRADPARGPTGRHIPVQTRRDAAGALQVFSTGGEILVDRKAAVLEFRTTPAIDTTMLFGNSILSGIRIDGREIAFGTPPHLSAAGVSRRCSRSATHGPRRRRRGSTAWRAILSNGSRRRASIRRFCQRCGVVHRWGHAATRLWNRGFPPASPSTPPCARRMAAPCGACATASAPQPRARPESHAACGAGRRLSQTRVTASGSVHGHARKHGRPGVRS
jgi:hypothetical protein